MADAGLYAEINAAVRKALPTDAVLAGDSSQVTYFGSVHFFDMPAPRRFCYTPGFATLGYGLPAGLGAAIARPGKPVAVLLGDGALMFSVQELVALVERQLPVPVIVVDSGGYREIRDQQRMRGTSRRSASTCAPRTWPRWPSPWAPKGCAPPRRPTCPSWSVCALGADGPTLIHFDIR